MKYKKIKLNVVFLLFIILEGYTQEVVPATGGNASGSGGSVSYSVGQIVYTTNAGVNGSVAQGIQQPYEISIITELEEAKKINLFCSVFPNPATEILTLKVENYNNKILSYRLFDTSGKLLEDKKSEGNETSIVIGNLVPATYFIKVMESNKEIKIFKIIKK